MKNITRPFFAVCLSKCELVILKKEDLETLINKDKMDYEVH